MTFLMPRLAAGRGIIFGLGFPSRCQDGLCAKSRRPSRLDAGDTDLDGSATQEDYRNIVAGMSKTHVHWFIGDLNHNGAVSAHDLAVVSLNVGAGVKDGPPLAAAKVKVNTATRTPKTASVVSGRRRSTRFGRRPGV